MNELNIDSFAYKTLHTRKFLMRKPYAPPAPGLVAAFIPGVITEVFVSEGQTVKKGDKLVILEAMKMLNEIMAPIDGTVKSVSVKSGDKVTKNQPLIELEPAPAD
ncbi:MAG: acetyl-CoA carboxylase biotin carboxyl carrier protein subunit [Bacteroidetes bacterium]|nr:acetyl-CoA carboxylase biotin carboxyl carrier protein subunit [Bacteroidota bacterium]